MFFSSFLQKQTNLSYLYLAHNALESVPLNLPESLRILHLQVSKYFFNIVQQKAWIMIQLKSDHFCFLSLLVCNLVHTVLALPSSKNIPLKLIKHLDIPAPDYIQHHCTCAQPIFETVKKSNQVVETLNNSLEQSKIENLLVTKAVLVADFNCNTGICHIFAYKHCWFLYFKGSHLSQ